MAAALLLSALVGIALGMLGGGGAILAVPILVHVAGIAAKEAIVMSLAIVGATSCLAFALHAASGQVDYKLGAVFAASGMAGAYLGAHVHRLWPADLLIALFATLMLISGSLMIRNNVGEPAETQPRRNALAPALAVGAFVGFVTGLLGVGGGFVIVPAMVLIERLPMRLAVGTSLLVITVNSLAGLGSHLVHSRIDPVLTGGFTAVALSGAFLGKRLGGKISPGNLRRGFGILIVAVGLSVGLHLAASHLANHERPAARPVTAAPGS